MRTSYKTIIIALILFLLDFVLTLYYVNSSAYAHEGNPLIYINNGYIILGINLVYLIVLFIFSKIVEKYKTVVLKAKNSFDYVRKLYKSDHYRFIFVSLAFAFVYASIVSRIIVVIDWIVFGIYDYDFPYTIYSKLRDLMPFGRYDIIFGILSFFILIPIWYRMEYKKSKTLCEK